MKTHMRIVAALLTLGIVSTALRADGPVVNRDNKGGEDSAEGTYRSLIRLRRWPKVRNHSPASAITSMCRADSVIDSKTGKEITGLLGARLRRRSSDRGEWSSVRCIRDGRGRFGDGARREVTGRCEVQGLR